MMMTKYIETPLNEQFSNKFEIASIKEHDENTAIIRKEAFDYFLSNGFPSIKNEEWRFTNMLPFLRDSYNLEYKESNISEDAYNDLKEKLEQHKKTLNIGEDTYIIVTLNGKIRKELSNMPEDGLPEIINLSEAQDHQTYKSLFGKVAHEKHYPVLNSFEFGKIPLNDGFSALNTALFQDGLLIHLADNKVVEKTIHLIHLYSATENIWLQPRLLINLGKNSEMSIIESIVRDESENKIFINSVTEINLETQAHFHHYDIQNGQENIRCVQRTEAAQKKHSNYSNYTFTFPGADLVRNTLNLHLDEDEIESHFYGLYLTAGDQIVDNHTAVHHKKERCESNQLYKGVLKDNSKAVFNGKIYVYEDAQLTNAFQQSNNILLSENATINTKPQLEIWADDVKASHGTTVGQLDEEAIFYLQSRGISKNAAQNIMINAFAYDVTEKVAEQSLKKYLEKEIERTMNL